jgi:transcriptional regulator with PAS, ATPase and Fis domain
MTLNLKNIQDIVIVYTDILAQIVKMDVAIVDADLNRISISRKSRSKEIDTNVADEGHILKKAIESGQTQIVTEPGEDFVCADCASRENCIELFHMCTPIMVKGKAIGAIAFVCFDQVSRKRALRNQSAYRQFIQQFADLIAAKALETAETLKSESMLNLLETIIDQINTGVIVFGLNNDIVRINPVAKRVLRMKENENITVADLRETGISVLDSKQYLLNLNGKAYNLIGKSFELKLDFYSRFFLFQEAERTAVDIDNTQIGEISASGVNRILGKTMQMADVRNSLLKFANSPSPVLITGEGGTETYDLALALHEESQRKGQPFFALQCTALSTEQLSQELFGIAPPDKIGSKGKIGKIETANKGTVFIEEIGDMDLSLQTQLLATLETYRVIRNGGTKSYKVGTRIIASTSKDLYVLLQEGRFLEKLYYKLNVLPIDLPPLRERSNDIILLSQKYVQKYERVLGKFVHSIESDFWKSLMRYSWPGNVWELENTIEYVINLMGVNGIIDSDLLPAKIKQIAKNEVEIEEWSIKNMEKYMIQQALEQFGDSMEAKGLIAQKLDISIATLYRKMKKYGFMS